jgi:cupin 2 domain-containing protein
VSTGNLFAGTGPLDAERFETLLEHRNLVIERITSPASTSRTEYLQPQDEWVVLLEGEATMTVDGRPVTLKRGDHVFLPARVPHTVEKVSAGAVWLAVHLHPE